MNINSNKVAQFQQLFDTIGESPNFDAMELRIKLIQEELDELKEAFLQGDMVEIADAYGDILFITIGGILKNGLEPKFEAIFDEICDSNLSKADDTLCDALKTRDKYLELNVETYFQLNPNFNKYVTYRKSDGKVLKSHNYIAVDLEQFVTNF
jgi:predicted HAD superfamily Cof-like phosphohydrolase